MTELQQELLMKLQPYTDKTLSEGCVFKWGWNYNRFLYLETHPRENAIHYIMRGKPTIMWESLFRVHKILGHYDITALLKCVANARNVKWLIFEQFPQIKNDKIIFEYRWSWVARFIEIPLIPLDSYTDEQTQEAIIFIDTLLWINAKDVTR
jgi:hypothetical protein